MAVLNFNRTTDVPADDTLPAGVYTAEIVDSKMKPSAKDPQNQYLELVFNVAAPAEHVGRKLWWRLNLLNSNQTAKSMALRDMGKLLDAINAFRKSRNKPELVQVTNSEDLHFQPVNLTVIIKDGRNEIKTVAPAVAVPAGVPGAAPVAAPVPPAAAAPPAGRLPWETK